MYVESTMASASSEDEEMEDDNNDEDAHRDQYEWLNPEDVIAAGERSKEQSTITAYVNAFERFDDWVFEMREAVRNEPLLDETVQVFQDGSYKLNWTAFLKSLEKNDNLYFR